MSPRTIWASLSPRRRSTGLPFERSLRLSSQTWLAQPMTLLWSVRASSGRGGIMRPSSIR
jgi:hypothetical protein